jgi:hypothetical protein
MGCLMHEAFDDEDSNGVIYTSTKDSPDFYEVMVQKGAVSVTNPEARAVPEIWSIDRETGEGRKKQRTNVMAKGILGKEERAMLTDAVRKIHKFYYQPMDLEFKFLEEVDPATNKKVKHLKIKQARPYVEN